MTAFVDESIRDGPDGSYVVAAVVLSTSDFDARDAARRLLLPGQRRLHWHDEGEDRRTLILERLAELGLECRTYLCALGAGRRQPRARALCLNALLWDLWRQADVDSVVIESRGDRDDRRDRSTIVAAQRSMRASPTIAYRFERPSVEPMLWWADALAGAAALATRGTRMLDTIGLRLVHTDVIP